MLSLTSWFQFLNPVNTTFTSSYWLPLRPHSKELTIPNPIVNSLPRSKIMVQKPLVRKTAPLVNPLSVIMSVWVAVCASMLQRNDKRYFSIPRQRRNPTSELLVESYVIPHDDKIEKGGEDAWFVSDNGLTIGVFDGVGGWATAGVDPRDYSQSLSVNCKYAVDSLDKRRPVEILRYGYDCSQNVTGSSTACIITVNGNQLESANLGDSGLRIIRKGQIIYASVSQQHRFNTPFQLGTQSDDIPEMAEIVNFTLEPGDLIVLGTDGLFDNLYDEDIISVISSNSNPIHSLAEEIAKKAYEISKQNQVKIPFNDMAELHYGMTVWENGKQDDITVVVAHYHG